MSPFEHALIASGALLPHELDESVARQLIFGGELATSLLETTSLSEERLIQILKDATGMCPAPPPPWCIETSLTRSLFERGLTAIAIVQATSDRGLALVFPGNTTDEQRADALGIAARTTSLPAETCGALEFRMLEAASQLGLCRLDERLERLTSRSGKWSHTTAEPGLTRPEPLAPLRTEFQPPAPVEFENTAPPPEGYEDVAARAAREAPPSDQAENQPELDRTSPLESAKTRDAVILAGLTALGETFRFVACFAVQKGEARGTFSLQQSAAPASISDLAIPLDIQSVFQRALESDRLTVTRPKASGLEGGVLEDLGRPPGTEILLLPIRLRKRPVLLFWTDNGRSGQIPNNLAEDTSKLQQRITLAIERVLIERKRQSQLAASARIMTPVPAALGSAELSLREVANALDPSNAEAPVPSPSPSSLTGPYSVNELKANSLLELDEPRLSARTLVSSRPFPDAARATAQNGEDTLPHREPFPAADPTPSPLIDLAAVSPSPAEASADSPGPVSLRPSQLPPPDEYEALLDQLALGDESVIARFIDGGEAAVGALMMNFPGRVSEPKTTKVRAEDCGPVLKALIRIGRRSIPFLTVRTWDESPYVRRWATFALGELPSRDSGEAIARRLLDRSPEVRRAALTSARRVQPDLIARRALRAIIEQYAFDTSIHADSRAGAVEALVDIREPAAIPSLLRLMDDPDKSVRRAAKWALTVLLRQDFGTDVAAWTAFWEAHRDEDRVEWLILALDHPSSDLRRAAGDELTTLAGDSFGFDAHKTDADRRSAQHQFRKWWEELGRTLLAKPNL